MLTRSKLKLGEGEFVEINPEIGRVYLRKTMSEEGPMGPDPQFIESFLAIKSMVEEMYRDFRKHRDEDSSGSKQDKGEDESHSHNHSKGKGKEESFLTPPNSLVHNKKASIHILHEPSFFLTKTISDPHGDVLGLINPFSSNSCTCFLISAFSKADNLYISMLGKEACCYKIISCTISFLGGRPLGS